MSVLHQHRITAQNHRDLQPKHSRDEWRTRILWVLCDPGAQMSAAQIAKSIAHVHDETIADSTRGPLYEAIRSLVRDGSIKRLEYRASGFRKNVEYRLVASGQLT